MWHLEHEQQKKKAFVNRHRMTKEKFFDIGKSILFFQTKMGFMPRKRRFRWTGPFWIVNSYNGTYQIGMLVGEVLPKWVKGFQLQAVSRADPGKSIPTRGFE